MSVCLSGLGFLNIVYMTYVSLRCLDRAGTLLEFRDSVVENVIVGSASVV
jgi:hypothetical protein